MPARIGLRLLDWPTQDRHAWTRATASTDFFATDAPATHWRPKTHYQALTAYGRWLAFLSHTCPKALMQEPARRISTERFAGYVDALRQRMTAMSIAAEINHLCLALRAIAPGIDLARLANVQRRYARLAQPRERRHKILDARRLYAVGVGLMTAARAADQRTAARDYRDGLLIALLVSRPLRRKNLAELEIGTHLLPVNEGFRLIIPGDAAKSGQPLEYDVPDELVPYLWVYLRDYRRRFPNADRHAALWPSTKGGRLGADGVYALVCKRTRAAFGHEINPHMFRSIAVTTLVREAPALSLAASDLLGHAKSETTDRYYTISKTIDASRRHGELIAHLRKQ